jgi:hypothetical protein
VIIKHTSLNISTLFFQSKMAGDDDVEMMPSWMKAAKEAARAADDHLDGPSSKRSRLEGLPKEKNSEGNNQWDGGGYGYWAAQEEDGDKKDPRRYVKPKKKKTTGAGDEQSWGSEGWGQSPVPPQARSYGFNVEDTIVKLVTMVLSMAGDLRETRAAVAITFLISCSHPIIKKALEAGKVYASTKDKTNLPSPHIWICAAAMEEMRKVNIAIQKFWVERIVPSKKGEELGCLVSLFTVRKATGKGSKGKGKGKKGEETTSTTSSSSSSAAAAAGAVPKEEDGNAVVQIAFSAGAPQEIVAAVIHVLSEAAGNEGRRHGKAPAGGQERALKDALQMILKAKGKGKGK